jgi:hypothetical protein
MVSEELRLFEKKIDSIIYDLQRFMDTDCHAEMCHDCKGRINFIERNLSKLKEEIKKCHK